MSEYVMVEKKWLTNIAACEECPFDGVQCKTMIDGKLVVDGRTCVDILLEYAPESVKPFPTSALFADRLERVLKDLLKDELLNSDIWTIPDRRRELITEAESILADIQKAKGGE